MKPILLINLFRNAGVRRRLTICSISIFVACLMFSSMARADVETMRKRVPQIAEMKDKGLIGEQPDGYLGVIKAEGEARAVVDAENRDRREEYEKRASSQGKTVDVLAKVLGEARIRDEKPGRFVRTESGEWVKK
ncbi:MAG: YdbL family protein [Deltaproteobacteria bacterium]|nr:YdbL family protein [Deltaproteobacteria bacterium]